MTKAQRHLLKPINERIITILEKVYNGNASNMARDLDIKRSTLGSLINPPYCSPSYEILERIAKNASYKINKDWLLTGEGYMIDEIESADHVSIAGVPYYDEDFTMGFDEMAAPFSEGPKFLINIPQYSNATLWCNATGNSMSPEISHNDVVALQLIEDPSFLLYGEIYAIVTTNGMRTIKRLGRSEASDCYRLIPTNKEYDSQDIPKTSILRVFKVLGALHHF